MSIGVVYSPLRFNDGFGNRCVDRALKLWAIEREIDSGPRRQFNALVERLKAALKRLFEKRGFFVL